MRHGPSNRSTSRGARSVTHRARITVGGIVLALVAGMVPVFAAAPAGAVTIGAPSNATARAGNEDESAVAVNPSNAQQIAVMANGIAGDAGLPLSISSDGGQNWTRTVFATGTGAGGDGRPVACCDPTLSWDNHGNLFVGYLQRTPRTIELYATSDLGANFTNLGPVDTGAAGSLDQPTVVAAQNSVWVAWRDDTGGIGARGRSVTGALTFGAWGAEQGVSTTGNFGDIAIGPTGEVMVTYETPTNNQGPANILVQTDADGLGAGAFGAAVTVTATNVGGFDFLPAQQTRSVDAEPGLAWDRTGGANNDRVYLVYTDEATDENNDFNIFVRTSTNDGATWGAPVRVNDDAGTNSQMLPKIALDQSNGDVGVSFYDARNDTGGGPNATDLDGTANNDVTMFVSWSTNGGANWAANVAVADAPTNGYAMNGGQQLGDYTGLAFGGGIMYPSWADSSNSTGDNPSGTLVNLDVYTAAVRPRNTAPTVAVGAASGAEGSAIGLSGTATDPDLDALSYAWTVTSNVGNDVGAQCFVTAGGTTLTPTIRCSDDGAFTATLTVTGDAAGPVTASGAVLVSNVAPTIVTPSVTPASMTEGSTTAFAAGFFDPGWNDTYSGSVDWGFGPADSVVPAVTTQGSPGVADAGSIAGTHRYMDDGLFSVTGSVTDDDGGTGSGSAALVVTNVAPTAAIDETGTILVNGVPTLIVHAGATVPFLGTSTDPGSDDLTLTWDWDDGAPAPDVTSTSLHAPPNPDPDPSPDGSARNVTDARNHAFADACYYDVRFASADDDNGSAADDLSVIVAGNFTDSRSHGYFKNELRKLRDHTGAQVQCLLKITGFMSRVFHEVRDASTPALATAVFDKSGSSLATDIFDLQLLAAWMNFADGRVALTDLVDTNWNGVPDTRFSDLVAQAEAVRLNPFATRSQLLAQKDRLDSFNNSGI